MPDLHLLESYQKVDQELERLLTQETRDAASVSRLWADVTQLLSADEVRQRLDIVEVVSEYVQLRKAGRHFKARCPFHSERIPSFFVFPERQTWRCFGACGTGGDVFSLLMKAENIEFPETLRRLALRAGVALSPPSPEAGAPDRDELQRAHRKVEAVMEALELLDFEESREFYHRNLDSLLATYRGMYIAITGGEVVDSDSDFSELAARVYKKYGYRHFFMPKVVRNRVVTVSGPRRR